MKLLFLDIDGVLNDHCRLPNGLCTIQPDKAAHLNRILEEVPDVQLVISSAWRYYIHNGYMTPQGFELMLQTHGVNCYQRIHGFTDPDPETYIPSEHTAPFDKDLWHQKGLRWRACQIADYSERHRFPWCAVLDDLPLCLGDALIQTKEDVGLTSEIADAVIRRLQAKEATP